jgi:hypothetical protein
MARSIPASLRKPAVDNSDATNWFLTDHPKENHPDVICFTKDFGGLA